ncbi:hypothetical protein [Streptomyces sp. PU-14G]|uniref:hypothetical protein n=1 Tax=Streptomyces sp. PU-14G TaxID=2800808 RepID=UPI0034E0064D
MVRTATTLHRLLDAAPALAGDRRIRPYVTLVPGSEFDADALAALEGLRALQLPWEEARRRPFALVLAASARGALHLLRGPLALLPHGAGFSKRMPARSRDDPSRQAEKDPANGLHPEQLLRPDGRPLAALKWRTRRGAAPVGPRAPRVPHRCGDAPPRYWRPAPPHPR